MSYIYMYVHVPAPFHVVPLLSIITVDGLLCMYGLFPRPRVRDRSASNALLKKELLSVPHTFAASSGRVKVRGMLKLCGNFFNYYFFLFSLPSN